MRVPLIYKDAPQYGFDIGTHNVKIVQLRKAGSKTVVQGYGSAYFPPESVVEGIVTDPLAMAKAIKPLLHKLSYGKLTSHRVVTGLPAGKLFTRTLQLPPMSASDLHQAIAYEVEQYVPVPVADLYIDHEVVNTTPGKDGRMDVVMMAAPRAIVDSYLKLFDELGLEVGAIEAGMSAVVRALLHSGDAGGSTLVVDIGSISSDLTIYDTFIPLTGSVPVGGQHYTDALVSQLGIKVEEANEIKEKFGLTPSGMHDKVYPALEPQLQTLVKEIKRVIKFYESRHEEPKKVASLVLSGGTAQMPGLDEYLRQQVGLPLTVGDPWKNLDIKKANHPQETPMYVTAIGLALRGPV
ncbi:MAG TPA: type IV pilus assembly protein PilM [Candidatus Saccharimonadia bacterium]